MSKELSPLEALYRLVFSAVEDENRTVEECLEYQHIIETALKRNNKLEKALEIIKEKRVDVSYLVISEDLHDYNEGLDRKWKLTQEEYELLKEELE